MILNYCFFPVFLCTKHTKACKQKKKNKELRDGEETGDLYSRVGRGGPLPPLTPCFVPTPAHVRLFCRQFCSPPSCSPLSCLGDVALGMLNGSSSFRQDFRESCSLWGALGSSCRERRGGQEVTVPAGTRCNGG